MAEKNPHLDYLERIQKKFGRYIELMKQLEDLKDDPELTALISSIQPNGKTPSKLPDTIEESPDEDELGLIAGSREETVRNLVRLLGVGSPFDREDIHDVATTAIPRWASKNDLKSVGDSLNSLARRGFLEVYRKAKVGPKGKPAAFRLLGEPEEGTQEQNQRETKGDNDDAETIAP